MIGGINNPNRPGIPPDSVERFKESLIQEGVDQKYVHLTSLFPTFDGKVKDWSDIGAWISDAKGLNGALTNDVEQQLLDQYKNLTPEERSARHVDISYSGGTNPTLKAIARNSNIPVDVEISWGGPTLDLPTDFSANPRFKNFINVWGSEDKYEKWFSLGGVGASTREQDLNKAGIKTTNIFVLGAYHDDIWYSDAKWKTELDTTTDPAKRTQLLEKIETNKFTTKFMAQMAKAARTDVKLEEFLGQDGITSDKDGNLIVDRKKIKLS